MTKATWKQSVLEQIKFITSETNRLVFTSKQLEPHLDIMLQDTQSRSKQPVRTLLTTLKELSDLNILIHRKDLGGRVFEYIPDSPNQELLYRDRRSTGHIRITNFLKRCGIAFQEEKTFKELKHLSFLRFDIYFTFYKCKVAIEYDGVQHEKAVEEWGGTETLKTNKHRDSIKDEYCGENGIILLRVTHDIKNIEKYVAAFLALLYCTCCREPVFKDPINEMLYQLVLIMCVGNIFS